MEPVPYKSHKRKLTCPLNSVCLLNDKKLKICCITYNMHGENPTQQEVAQFLNPHKNYDIYAIGSEECLRSIFKSLFWSDKSSWENKLSNYFGNEYIKLNSVTLAAIHLIIYVKYSLRNYVEFLGKNSVKTGAKNLLGNKGAVGIWFRIYNIKVLIINSHLAAKMNYSHKRNENFHRIMRNIYNNNRNRIDYTIFMGDLNYRLNLQYPINIRDMENDYKKYLLYDQLYLEKRLNRLNLEGFQEGEIDFLPTFKFYNRTNIWENTKPDNSPAWTDRILFMKRDTKFSVFDVTLKRYDSMPQLIMSDHKPVYAIFEFTIRI
jgi:hypothetical protein